MSAQELTSFGKRAGLEHDPRKRLALRQDMLHLWGHVNDGRIPITEKNRGIKELAARLTREKDIHGREKIEAQMANELQKIAPTREFQSISKNNVATLKQQLSNQPNPDARRQMEHRLNQLEQSVETSQQIQANMNHIEEVSSRAAKETDPTKRNEILGSLKHLCGTSGRGNSFGNRHSETDAKATRERPTTRLDQASSPVTTDS